MANDTKERILEAALEMFTRIFMGIMERDYSGRMILRKQRKQLSR